jgi:hypothetical protein
VSFQNAPTQALLIARKLPMSSSQLTSFLDFRVPSVTTLGDHYRAIPTATEYPNCHL